MTYILTQTLDDFEPQTEIIGIFTDPKEAQRIAALHTDLPNGYAYKYNIDPIEVDALAGAEIVSCFYGSRRRRFGRLEEDRVWEVKEVRRRPPEPAVTRLDHERAKITDGTLRILDDIVYPADIVLTVIAPTEELCKLFLEAEWCKALLIGTSYRKDDEIKDQR